MKSLYSHIYSSIHHNFCPDAKKSRGCYKVMILRIHVTKLSHVFVCEVVMELCCERVAQERKFFFPGKSK